MLNGELPKMYDLDQPIRNFVSKRLIEIESYRTVQEAAKKMVEFNISSLAVVEEGSIIGFITDGDIKRKVVAEGLDPGISVEEIMIEELITEDIDITVQEALDTMTKKNIKHLLVTEGTDVVGIVTLTDLLDIKRHSLDTYISRE